MIRYHARWVIPISRPPIRDGTVAAADGRITYAGPRANAPAGEDRDLGNAILLPGLVNTHTHLELTAFRGAIPPLPFREWIAALQAAKTAVMTRDRYLDSARFGIAEGLRAGITTYADSCDSGVALEAMREAGVRGIMYQEVFGPDPSQAGDSLRALEQKLAALEPLATDLQRLGVSPHAPYTVSNELFRLVTALGRPMAIHIAESEEESRYVRDGEGPFADAHRKRGIPVAPRAPSPVVLLQKLRVLDAKPLLIHCVRIDDGDLGAIASHDCAIAHCPASNAHLGHGTAPLSEMLARQIRTGLGSDSMASNTRMDMLQEARLATRDQRARGKDLTTQQSLRLATLGGAEALGLGHRVGSLDVGKDADLAAFPLSNAPDPIAALLDPYAPASALAVVIAGIVKLWNGALLAPDPALPARVAAISAALAAR